MFELFVFFKGDIDKWFFVNEFYGGFGLVWLEVVIIC